MPKRRQRISARSLPGKLTTEYTYTVVLHPAEEGGFWAEVPALRGCNTQGETYEQTIEHARDAIEGYLRFLEKLGEPIPTEKQPRRVTVAAVKVAV